MNAIKVWVNNTKALSAIESFMVDNAFVLLDKKKVNATETHFTLPRTNEILMVKITSQENEIVTKKIVN